MIRLLIAMIMVPMTAVAGFAFSPGTKRPQCPVTPSATMSRTIATITKQSFLITRVLNSDLEMDLDYSLDDDEDEEEELDDDEDEYGEQVEDYREYDDEETADDEQDEIVRFVGMMKQTPAGVLEEDVALLLRETIEELISIVNHDDDDDENDEDVVGTLRLATDLLQRLVLEYQGVMRIDAQKAAVIAPSTADFNRLYDAWLAALTPTAKKSSPPQGNVVATHVLPAATQTVQELFALQQQPDLQATAGPNIRSYELLLTILSQSRFCSKEVWRIFSDIPDKTVPMYEAAISSTAKSRHTHAASRAESLLKEAVEDLSLTVSIEACNRVVTAWAKSGKSFGPERAEGLIRWMDSTAGLSPNAQTFTSLMDAHAQQVTWDAAVQCERILKNLVDLYVQENDPSLAPTAATWTIPLQTWSRLAKKRWNKAAGRAARVFRQWRDLHQEGKVAQGPDGLAYQMVLNAFVRSDAAEAEAWLDEQYEAFTESGDVSLRPTARSVRNVVEAWTRQQDDPNAMEEAEFIWERYQDLIEETGDAEVIADVYRTLLFGFCQRQDSARALELLEEMVERDLKPDCFCYDRVLEANTQLISSDEDEDNSVMVERAYAIFSLMEKERQAGNIKPNERVYTSFIRALTKAKIPNLAYKARLLLQRMRELSKTDHNPALRPTVFTYNAVLMSAATEGVPAAFTTALQTFNELRKDSTAELDHVSIGNMLRCAKLLVDDDEDSKRVALIESTFGLGCRMGLINPFVVRDLRMVASRDLQAKLLGAEYGEDEEDATIVDELPSQWTYKAMAKYKNKRE